MALTEVEREALRLSEEERAILAEHLLSSLPDDAGAGLNEERWIEEAERRYREYRAGNITARPAADVFQDAHRLLG